MQQQAREKWASKRQPCVVRGRVYPSQKAAAAAFGVSETAVAEALRRRGDLETLGLPLSGAGRGNTNSRACPVMIGHLRFRSHKAAAEALGVSRSMIRRWVASGAALQDAPVIYAAALRYRPEGAAA